MQKILLAGSDFRLLGTRAAVLGRTGASVVCCSATEARMILEGERFDLVVLCHTLLEQEVGEMTHSIHRLWPKTRILHVVSDIAQERFYDGIELDATSSAEPKHLVRRTTELLESLPNHRIAETAGGVRRQEAL